MPYTILHYSDPHFGACDPAIAQCALETAHALAPDLTVVSGDFTMRGRRREFAAASEWYQKLPENRLAYPGNHDVPGLNQIWHRFFRPFKRYRQAISETEAPKRQLGDIAAICTANSSTPFGLHLDWSLGFLSPLQTMAMQDFFSHQPPDRLRIYGIHHPLLGSGEKKRALVAPLPLVSNALQNARVDLVLAGHFHQSRTGLFPDSTNAGTEHQCIVSQAPSICSTRLKGEANGFHLIQLEKEKIQIELQRWQGQEFSTVQRQAYEKISDRWTASAEK